MIIGIDLDGVVFDSEEYYRTYTHLYDIFLLKNGLHNKKEMNVFDRLNWDKDTANKFFAEYTAEVLNSAPLKAGAKFVLNKLKEMGHTLVCITLRGYYRECEYEITERRLKEEGIVFDKIIYNQKNKTLCCKEEKIDLMIEDSHSNIKTLTKNKIKCIHFRGAGLKKVRNKNVIEVQNWACVLEEIMKMQK